MNPQRTDNSVLTVCLTSGGRSRIERSPENARRVYAALADFGAPIKAYTPEDFVEAYSALQIGVAPVRIDILTHVDGVRFSTAWKNRKTVTVSGTRVHILSRADLIRAKAAAGRRQDLDDLDWLKGKA